MVLLALAATFALGQQGQPLPPKTPTPTLGAAETVLTPKARTFSPRANSVAGSVTKRRPVPTVPAIYGNWRSCQIGGGGYLQRVTYTSDPKILYAHVDVGGIYRSDDGGRRWRMLHGTLPQLGALAVRDLSVDPKDPERVLALVGDQFSAPQGLFETHDGGRTWRKLLTLTAFGNGPLRWTGTLLARDPNDSRTILVGSAGEGIYRSSDEGRTWRQIGAGAAEPNGALRDVYLTDLHFDRSDSRRVWAAAIPTRTFTFAAQGERSYRGGWFSSEDGGRTWFRLGDEAPTEFVQDGARPERLIGIFDELDVRVSDDGGQRWRPYDEGLTLAADPEREPYLSDSRFDAISAGPGFQLLMTTRGTLYRRNTNETAWEQVLPEGTTQIYEGRPWVSEDGPERFQHFGAAAASVSIDPRDPNHLWFADWYAIYESRDGGKNWDLSIDGIESSVILGFESDPKQPEIVHIGVADNGYLGSRDGGTTFEPPRLDTGRINSNMKTISAAGWDPSRLLATGDPGDAQWIANTIWVSIDRGASWTRSPMTGLPNREGHTINTVAWDPSRENRAYAAVGGVGGGIFVSTDGGLSWLRDSDGLPIESDLFIKDLWTVGREVAANGDGDLVVVSKPRSEVYRRENGLFLKIAANVTGRTTTATNGIEGEPNDVVAAETKGGAFFVATDRGVFRSEDAGKSWVRTLQRPTRYLAIDRTNPRRVAAGCDGAVLLSEDGGLRWRETDSALPDRNSPRVGFGAGRLLAGTSGSGAFWLPLESKAYAVAEVKPLPRKAFELPVPRIVTVAGKPSVTRGTMLDLLLDGGFEDPRRFASRWTVGYTGRGRLEVASVGSTPALGARSLRLRAVSDNSAGSASARLTSPPRKFRVTGTARSAGATTEALVGVQGFDKDSRPTGFVVLFDARNADKWRRFSADVELPTGTENANLVVTYAGSGSVSLDDIAFEAIVEGVTDPARPLPTDILANGGFEDGAAIATDWTVGYLAKGQLQISATPVLPHSGERALAVRNVGSQPAEGAAAYKLLKLPRRFRFEGFARVEGKPGAALVAIQAFDIDGRQTTFSVAIDAKTATGWQSFSTEIELPDDVETAYVVATFEGTGSLLLDDLRLTTLIERRSR